MTYLKSIAKASTLRLPAFTSMIAIALFSLQSASALPLPKLKPTPTTADSFTSIGETSTPVKDVSATAATSKKVVSRSVVDQANILDKESEFRLTQALGQFQLEKKVQIVVLTTTSLRGYDIEKYSAAVSKQWGVAERREKPGILVVVAPNEEFVKIRVGPGLQEWMPSEVAQHLVDKYMVPAFAQSKWQEGIVRGTAGIIAVLGREQPINMTQITGITEQTATTTTPVATSPQALPAQTGSPTVSTPSPTLASAVVEPKSTNILSALIWPFLMLLLAFAALGLFWYRGRQVEDLANGKSIQDAEKATISENDLDIA